MSLRFPLLLPFAALAGVAAAQDVYMSGLSSPRNLYFDTDGTLLVAEAGSGGLSGGIASRKGSDAQGTYLTGLPSAAAPDGSDSVGPADLMRTADGRLAVLFGLGGSPAKRTALGDDYGKLGTLSFYDPNTKSWSLGEDYATREATEDPDKTGNPATDEINSNPYSFVADGAGYAVVDAGANALWRDDTTTLFTRQDVPFGGGSFPMDAVPTSILARPGGGFLVGELGGFPFAPGKSRIYTLDANGVIDTTKTLDGFTAILDMAYAPDGSLLVAQFVDKGLNQDPTKPFDPTGSIKRLRPDGTIETLISGLVTPTSIAFGPDGSLYVTDTDRQLGGLVRRYAYQPVPEPATFAALGLGALTMLRRRKRA